MFPGRRNDANSNRTGREEGHRQNHPQDFCTPDAPEVVSPESCLCPDRNTVGEGGTDSGPGGSSRGDVSRECSRCRREEIIGANGTD
jgi:hypothetical protein